MTLNIKWKDIDYKLSAPILKAIEKDLGFDKVMPVQNSVIPNFCKNYDMAVEAATGSGKTLAFLIPIFEKLIKEADSLSSGTIKALVISPTRELAFQTYQVATKLQNSLGKLGVSCVHGKISDKETGSELKSNGQNILICTPGRLNEIVKDHTKDLRQVDFLILGSF